MNMQKILRVLLLVVFITVTIMSTSRPLPGSAATISSVNNNENANKWLSFDGSDSSIPPTLSMTYSDPTRIDLIAVIPGIEVSVYITTGGAFTRLSGNGFGFGTKAGFPDLPVLRRDIEIPFGAQVSMEIINEKASDLNLVDLNLNHPILPLQPSRCKCAQAGDQSLFTKDPIYFTDAYFPNTPVTISGEYIIRGHRVITIDIWPVAYNPVSGDLRFYSQLDFRLNLEGSDLSLTKSKADRYASPVFESRLIRQLLNFNQGNSPHDFTALGVNPSYLIITADIFADQLTPFVNLKTSQGYSVTLTKLSLIPGGSANTDIKAYIQNAYDTWEIPPSYVLLVGDTNNGQNSMPGWNSTAASQITDLYYGTVDGPDWVPDIERGRFPARTTQQLDNIVNKYLTYAGNFGSEPWVKKAAFIATCDLYTIAEGTHNYVIDTYTNPLGYSGIFPNNPNPGGDQLFCVTNHADAADISTSLNDGRVMAIYSGHGSYTGWEMNFQQANVRALSNDGIFPFVASHSCLTNNFNQTEVFGETWLIQEKTGALVFWGSSDYSYWDEDDVLERKMFDFLYAVYPDQVSVGAMTDDGLMGVQIAYPGMAQYYWEEYNILGDPGVEILLSAENPDFTLTTDPSTLQMCQASSDTSAIKINSLFGFNSPVTLSASGLPSGVRTQFSLNPVIPSGESVLTIQTTRKVVAGNYVITVTGDSTKISHSSELGIDIFTTRPGAVSLISPANGSRGILRMPTFSWTSGTQAESYTLEVARDLAFQNLVISATVMGTSYTSPIKLDPASKFYWRIRPLNACGIGKYSPIYSFTTR